MISFVIPAYNASKTIERTINSINSQEHTSLEYEIVVVDDGSDDDLCAVMQKFENEKKVKFYQKENTGVADTRNYGVNQANGEYIIFVDSDDYVRNSLLKDIEQYVKQHIDLIKWNAKIVDKNEKELYINDTIAFEKTTGENGFNMLFGKDHLMDCLWNYAIKKELMLEFPDGMYHEDFAVMPLMILNAKTMVSLDKTEYFYVQSENSIMRNQNEEKTRKKLQDKLVHYDKLIRETKNLKIEKFSKENLAIFATNSLLAVIPDLTPENKRWFKKELKSRKIAKNIKIRNFKQLIKRILLELEYFS